MHTEPRVSEIVMPYGSGFVSVGAGIPTEQTANIKIYF